MFRNQSAQAHQFSMVPRADIPRSRFKIESAYKTTFSSGFLVPFYVDEVLPGDSHSLKCTAFARMATPIVPFMDNIHLETFFFFVPNRLIWNNWVKFMGEQKDPQDSISFNVPQVVSPVGGFALLGIYDYMGLPTIGSTVDPAGTVSVNALPIRAYNLIWNEWFRDQNLADPAIVDLGDGPDLLQSLRRRGKRHDYFTSCLPWTQKGSPVTLSLVGNAPVRTQGTDLVTGAQPAIKFLQSVSGAAPANNTTGFGASGLGTTGTAAGATTAIYPSNLFADLSAATAQTVNQLRQSFQIQKLLERDARGGTRYTELLRSHFGVSSPDSRLQRPEYLGGGHTMLNVREVEQTQATSAGITPQGHLAATARAVIHNNGFRQSFTEHGYVIGLVSVRADLTYQQGTRKMWSRKTRYDFYWPVFSHLGEQAVTMKEIYTRGTIADDTVFGYQERWAEYRYMPGQITGLFRSTAAGTLDVWHCAQNFATPPALNEAFIQDTPPIFRLLADGTLNGEFILDAFFSNTAVRPLPAYSAPGLIDHF